MSSSKTLNTVFSSKVLLFGEYTVVTGSNALAFPFPEYGGKFESAGSIDRVDEDYRLDAFCEYLKQSDDLSQLIDTDRLLSDINNGLYFNANIPRGYGLGSSGALCAATYAHYAYDFERKSNYTSEEMARYKAIMAQMEGFFHGKSSGVDCLISLVDQPVLLGQNNQYDLVAFPDLSAFGDFYLYDSGISRKTGPLVQKFLKSCNENAEYKKSMDQLTVLMDRVIDDVLNTQTEGFKDRLYELSCQQYELFTDMIPDSVKSVWKKALDDQTHIFKLCGAGGGGFFLVYSDDEEYKNKCNYLRVNDFV